MLTNPKSEEIDRKVGRMSVTPDIRAYHESDLDDVMDVWEAANDVAHPFLETAFKAELKRKIRDELLPKVQTWVLCVDGQLQGFVSLVPGGPPVLEVGALFVRPTHFGRGYGRLLMDFIVAKSDQVKLEVFEKNERGLGFYRAYGFQLSGRYMFPETGDVMRKLTFVGCQERNTMSLRGESQPTNGRYA